MMRGGGAHGHIRECHHARHGRRSRGCVACECDSDLLRHRRECPGRPKKTRSGRPYSYDHTWTRKPSARSHHGRGECIRRSHESDSLASTLYDLCHFCAVQGDLYLLAKELRLGQPLLARVSALHPAVDPSANPTQKARNAEHVDSFVGSASGGALDARRRRPEQHQVIGGRSVFEDALSEKRRQVPARAALPQADVSQALARYPVSSLLAESRKLLPAQRVARLVCQYRMLAFSLHITVVTKISQPC